MPKYNKELTDTVKQVIKTIKQIRSSGYTNENLKLGNETAIELLQYRTSSKNEFDMFRIWPTPSYEDEYLKLSPNKQIYFWRSFKPYDIIINPKEKFYNEIDPLVIQEFKDLFVNYKPPIEESVSKNSNLLLIGLIGLGIFLAVKK